MSPDWCVMDSGVSVGRGPLAPPDLGVRGGTAALVFKQPSPTNERSFTIRLHLAELDDVRPGERNLDVLLHDQKVIANLDVVASAGGATNSVSPRGLRHPGP